MAGRVQWMLAAVLCAACGDRQPTAIPEAAPVDPKFAPGDRFKIHVANEAGMSGDFQVAEDGTINFSPIGRVKVAGRTQAVIEREIEAELAKGWLRNPHVRIVNLKEPRQVTVLGQVSKAGTFPFSDGLTLVQAVSLAGGTSRLARTTKVTLTRTTTDGRKTFEVDLSAIISGDRDDIVLAPGDVVFVPESPI